MEGIERLVVDIDDSVFVALDDDFWNAVDYVKKSIDNGIGVLIHCRKGISRSPALAIGALMKMGMDFDEAFLLVKSRRAQICINPGFIQQLKMRDIDNCVTRRKEMIMQSSPVV